MVAKTFVAIFSIMVSVLLGIFFVYNDHTAFAFEENILVLQTGIISTSDKDYAISQEFDSKIFQNGKIMRLSGLTTTGEQYYLYQKIIDEETVVRGKILVNDVFVPILQKEIFEEEKSIEDESKEIIVLVNQPHYGYYYDAYTLTAKAFDSRLNPKENFNQNEGYLEGVKINVTLTNRFDEILTSFAGVTNQFGTYTGKYLWGYGDVSGEYNVTVEVDYGKSITKQYYNTFYRGYISNYTG